MLKAGSLLYAIGICLVMALITGSIILFSYYNRIQLDDYILIEKVNKNYTHDGKTFEYGFLDLILDN